MKFIKSLCILLCFSYNTVFAQVESPPNLSLGAQGLIFEKGVIDVALLSELIVSKQEELKQEFIKRSVIKELNQNNFTSYAFTYSTLNDLMSIKDKKSLSKKVLIYIEDFALVYGFTEFYLQASGELGNPYLADFIKKVSPKATSTLSNPYTYFEEGKIKSRNLGINSSLVWPKFYLKKFGAYNVKEGITLTDYLVDFFYHVLKENSFVKERGFLKLENYGQIAYQYDSFNKFLNFKKDNIEDVDSDQLIDFLNKQIDILFQYYSVFKKNKDTKTKLIDLYPFAFQNMGKTNMQLSAMSEIGDSFSALEQDTHSFYGEINSIDLTNVNYSKETKDQLRAYALMAPNLMDAAQEILARFNTFKNQNTKGVIPFYASDLYYLKEKAKPALSFLTQYGSINEKYIDHIENLEESINKLLTIAVFRGLNELVDKQGNSMSILNESTLGMFGDAISLLSNLDQFNRAETYAEGLEVISNASVLLKNYKAGEYLQTVLSLLQTYTNVDTEGNKIYLNIEEIIVKLHERFAGKMGSSAVSFFFTLGVNTTLINDSSQPLLDSEGNPANNLIFASEKIGIKGKLWNFKRSRQRDFAKSIDDNEAIDLKKTLKPLISDIFVSAYTSGLLYNLVNTTNADEKLGGYMIGTSLGTSFFNKMDLHLFVNFYATKTQKLQLDNHIFGVAWDIPIVEYISALVKKRDKKELKE